MQSSPIEITSANPAREPPNHAGEAPPVTDRRGKGGDGQVPGTAQAPVFTKVPALLTM